MNQDNTKGNAVTYIRDKKHKYVFGVGSLNVIEYKNKDIFNILTLKNDVPIEASLLIDNIDYIKNPNGYSLISFKVRSAVCSLFVIFKVKEEEREEFLKSVTDSLLPLKDINPTNDEEIVNKIKSIFNIIINDNAAYILVDKNNNNNNKYLYLINPILDEYKDKTTLIVLEEQYNESTPKGKLLWRIFLEQKTFLIFYFFEAIVCTFLSIVAHYSYKTSDNNTVSVVMFILLGIFIIISIIILFLLMSSLKNTNKKLYKTKLTALSIYSLSLSVIGIGVAYIVLIILKKLNIIFEIEKWSNSYLLLSIIVSAFLIIMPITLYFIYLLVGKKKNKEE